MPSAAVYLRVSTSGQTVDQQRDAVVAGITPDKVFTDAASSRAGSDRPGWRDCLNRLLVGDTLVVAVDRLGRSVREVAQMIHDLAERRAALGSLREGVDTSTPTGRAVVSIMATVAQLEADRGGERWAASREARRALGLPATCPPKLDAQQQQRLRRLCEYGEPVSEVMGMFKVSRPTVFLVLPRAREAA